MLYFLKFSYKFLKGIFNLFTEKVQSSFNQIIQKIKTNEKFSNALNYFIKDFIFFHFCVENFSKRTKVEVNIKELKDLYFEKFSYSVNENITRAFNLVTSLERIYLGIVDNNGTSNYVNNTSKFF